MAILQNTALARTYTLNADTPKDVISAISGYYAGLLSHELGHYAAAKYSGGSFDGFDAPYGNMGEPTMYFDGKKSQLGLIAMAGNNTSLLWASRQSHDDEDKDKVFSRWFDYFHIFNPIGYVIKGQGDFDFATGQLGIHKDKLRVIVGIPAVQNMINYISPISVGGSLDISATSRRVQYNFTGPINTRQTYLATNDDNVNVDLSIGKTFGSYSFYYGEITETTNGLKSAPYMSLVKEFRSSFGTTNIEFKNLSGAEDRLILSQDYGYLSFGYDKVNGSNLSLKISF